MADMPCIYDMTMVSENLSEDILNGKALEVLLILLSGSRTVREIAKELKLPSFSLQLYIKRLLDNNLIKVVDTKVIEGKIEKTYELASSDISILNHIKDNYKMVDDKDNIELSAQHFASLTREVIRNIVNYKNKPHKIKAYFIKSDEGTMENFKKDLEELFKKYQDLENQDCEETYGFISVLAPYKLNK